MLPATLPAHRRRLDSPIGRILLVGTDSAVTGLAIATNGVLPHDDLADATTPVLDKAADQLGEYFGGSRRTFDVPVAFGGTPFQRSVWQQLAELDYGSVTTYGAIGIATGRPTAGRAVGGAVGANPVPILVPCHRVLAGNGRITGYSAGNGIPTKSWLLTLEGIEHVA